MDYRANRIGDLFYPCISSNRIGSARPTIMERNFRRFPGFTLIEVMVVIVILGILASIIVPRIMDRPDSARITKAQHDIRALESALKLYRLDNFTYPSTDQGLEALVEKPEGSPDAPNWNPAGYLDRLPKDPWGYAYQYLSPGQQGDFDIYSLGADNQLGGDGPGADIGNWSLE